MLIFNYALTQEDYVNYSVYVNWDAKENRKKKNVFFIRQVLILSTVIFIYHYSGLLETIGDFRYLIYALIIGLSVFSFFRIRSRYINAAKKFTENPNNSNCFLQNELTIAETGVSLKNHVSATTYTWEAFIKKQENENYYFLFISSIQAIIIPKRIIKTETEKETLNKLFLQYLSFVAEIEHLLKK